MITKSRDGSQGRLRIELNKFLISCFPVLLYFDAVMPHIRLALASVIPVPGKNAKEFHSNFHWEYPSDVLSRFVENTALTPEGMSRIITSSSRPTIVGFYTLARGLSQLKSKYPTVVLSFLNRHGKYDPASNTLDNDVCDVDRGANVKEGEEECWYHDPNIRQSIKQSLGTDIAVLVSRLASDMIYTKGKSH